MENTHNVQWKRIAAEGAAIVVSILLAFAIQAWWDERQDRLAEREILASVHEEFVENQRRFAAAFDHHDRIHDALVRISNSTPSDCSEDLAAALEAAILEWHSFDPVTGATQSLISSGRLGLISDEVLRVRLAAWSGLYSELQQEERRAVAARDRVSDYVAREFPVYECQVLLADDTFRFLLELREREEVEILGDNELIPESIQLILDSTNPVTM